MLKDMGVEGVVVRQSRHVIADCHTADGKVFRITFPVSPTDKRGILNLRAVVRRKLRQLEEQQ
jgi:hypothetical protein